MPVVIVEKVEGKGRKERKENATIYPRTDRLAEIPGYA